MNNKVKLLLIVIPVSFLAVGLTVLFYLIDPEFEVNAYKITSMVLVSVWAFFFAPTLPFAITWVKNYFDGLNFEQGFRVGYLLGRGWGIIVFLMFLIASPVIGTIWYIQTVKSLSQSHKNKRKSDIQDNEVFDI